MSSSCHVYTTIKNKVLSYMKLMTIVMIIDSEIITIYLCTESDPGSTLFKLFFSILLKNPKFILCLNFPQICFKKSQLQSLYYRCTALDIPDST